MKTPEEIQAINIVRVAAYNIVTLSGKLKKLESAEKINELNQIIKMIADSINTIADDLLKGRKQELGCLLLDKARLKHNDVFGCAFGGDFRDLSIKRFLPDEVGVSSSDHDRDVRETQKA
jgi:hypothetical protein